MKVAGLVLAAGRGSRMGAFKPLLPLGGSTLLERCVTLFRQAGVMRIGVVSGDRAALLRPELQRLEVAEIHNPEHHRGMFSSVQAGVAAWSDWAAEAEAFLLLPVDIPLVRSRTLQALLTAWGKEEPWQLHPTWRGERGHPPLLHRSLTPAILSWNGEQGLEGCLARDAVRNPSLVKELGVSDPMILVDLDTPEALRWAENRLAGFVPRGGVKSGGAVKA